MHTTIIHWVFTLHALKFPDNPPQLSMQLCQVYILVGAMAFNALTLLAGCQEGHLARKNLTDEVVVWLSSAVKCK